MKATFNITTDTIKFYPDSRLGASDYAIAKAARFRWWPGSKLFAAKWSPQAEDFVLGMGATIEEDDTPDDVAARVDRFANKAEQAQGAAESAENYLQTRANTERRRENATNAIEKNISLAEHYQRRIEGAICHAQYKDRPDVIARRIDELEKDRRRHVNSYTSDGSDGAKYGCPDSVFVARCGRGGHWVEKSKLPEIKAWADRWIAHIDARLQYERAMLAAAGGIVGGTGEAPIDKTVFQVGGAIQGSRAERWLIITRINRQTVEVHDPSCSWQKFRKVDRTTIKYVLSPEEVAKDHPELKLPVVVKNTPKGPAKAEGGKVCQVMGAAGFRSGFSFKGPPDQWRLIVKVNRTTIETLGKSQVQDGDGVVSNRYYIHKHAAADACEVKTPEQVKTDMPELLADWEAIQAIRARNAERQKARDIAEAQAKQPEPMFQ